MWIYILIALAIALLVLLTVIVVRTIAFKPSSTINPTLAPIEFDKDKAVYNLQQLVRCKTVSYRDSSLEDSEEFDKLVALLPTLYPNVHKACTLTTLDDRGLLYLWKGKDDSYSPAVLMAHYDVVPVVEEGWDEPAFEGIIKDGALWGRGTLDTKVTMNAILTASDHLIAEGFVPDRDIYFAFSGNEEINGKGAINIVDYFEKEGITPSFVLDEGGAVVENVFPGVKAPCGMIGIAEKGMIDLRYTIKSSGGHASAPKPHTPVGELSQACVNIENKPFKSHLTPPVAKMFDTLGRHSNILYRVIFANMWLFGGLLDSICKKSGGELNALMRTTVAFTQMQGSQASNVIPPEASMVSNIRLNPHDTMDSAVEYIKKVADNDNLDISIISGVNPSRISRTDCEGYAKVAHAVSSTWVGSIVTPYLMMQCSDSRHYGRISDKVYRFSAMDLTKEERSSIHGHNERIRLETIAKATEFYIRLMRSC